MLKCMNLSLSRLNSTKSEPDRKKYKKSIKSTSEQIFAEKMAKNDRFLRQILLLCLFKVTKPNIFDYDQLGNFPQMLKMWSNIYFEQFKGEKTFSQCKTPLIIAYHYCHIQHPPRTGYVAKGHTKKLVSNFIFFQDLKIQGVTNLI